MADIVWKLSVEERDLVVRMRRVSESYKQTEDAAKKAGAASDKAGKDADRSFAGAGRSAEGLRRGTQEAGAEATKLSTIAKGVGSSIASWAVGLVGFQQILRVVTGEVEAMKKATDAAFARGQSAIGASRGRAALPADAVDALLREPLRVPLDRRRRIVDAASSVDEGLTEEGIRSVLRLTEKTLGLLNEEQQVQMAGTHVALGKRVRDGSLSLNPNDLDDLAYTFASSNIAGADMDRFLAMNAAGGGVPLEEIISLAVGAKKFGANKLSFLQGVERESEDRARRNLTEGAAVSLSQSAGFAALPQAAREAALKEARDREEKRLAQEGVPREAVAAAFAQLSANPALLSPELRAQFLAARKDGGTVGEVFGAVRGRDLLAEARGRMGKTGTMDAALLASQSAIDASLDPLAAQSLAIARNQRTAASRSGALGFGAAMDSLMSRPSKIADYFSPLVPDSVQGPLLTRSDQRGSTEAMNNLEKAMVDLSAAMRKTAEYLGENFNSDAIRRNSEDPFRQRRSPSPLEIASPSPPPQIE
jgi:hypothetical protein